MRSSAVPHCAGEGAGLNRVAERSARQGAEVSTQRYHICRQAGQTRPYHVA
jgi:hypothetical protein